MPLLRTHQTPQTATGRPQYCRSTNPVWQAQGQPCFPPHTEARKEILGSDLGLRCRRWHPAQTPGVLRFASSALHILSQTLLRPFRRFRSPRAKGSAGLFQRGKFFGSNFTYPKTNFSKAQLQAQRTIRRTRSLLQAWIDSRNQTTIATQAKHRQLLFLHPTKNERESYGLMNLPVTLYTTGFPFQFILK